MRPSSYRLTVIACALTWLLVGMHLPSLHHIMTSHGGATRWSVLGFTLVFVVGGVVSVWALLRAAARPS